MIKGSNLPPEPHQAHEPIPGLQLEKADSRVNYSLPDAADTTWTCGDCRFFDAMCMKCAVVEGTIDASWKCDLWTAQFATGPMGSSGLAMYREPAFQVFVEASLAFTADADFSKPSWIPFLPTPGRFQHPTYGEVVITPGQSKEMVDSFKNKVYQEHIPLDAEHETKLSGAVAWLKDMRMNDNGSADALVEFTDRGQSLLKGGSFKYISPEWYADWRDPATGVVHRNVIVGGAITTRPFFKDKVLRALVASEAGSQVIGGTAPMPDPNKDKDVKPPVVEPKSFSEADHNRLIAEAVTAAEAKLRTELAGENKTFSERLSAAEETAKNEKTAREAAEARVANLEKTNRHQRFTDLVSGRGGAGDGAAWAGDAPKHIEMLESLATKVGEDDPIFTSYVEQQNAVAAQLKTSNLFREVGSAASGPSAHGTVSMTEAEGKIEAMVDKRVAADPKKSRAMHYSEVMETPEAQALYEADARQPRR